MSKRIGEMRNLGSAMERMLSEVDICDEQSLENIGAIAAYQRLKFRFGSHVNVIALYAMEASLQNRDWRSLCATEKETLKCKAKQGQVT